MMSQPAPKLLYLSTAQMDKNEFIFKDILQKVALDHKLIMFGGPWHSAVWKPLLHIGYYTVFNSNINQTASHH